MTKVQTFYVSSHELYWENKNINRQEKKVYWIKEKKDKVKYLSYKKNGLNPGVTYLDWKRSSGWLEESEKDCC